MECNSGIEIPEAWMPMMKKVQQQGSCMGSRLLREKLIKMVQIEMPNYNITVEDLTNYSEESCFKGKA